MKRTMLALAMFLFASAGTTAFATGGGSNAGNGVQFVAEGGTDVGHFSGENNGSKGGGGYRENGTEAHGFYGSGDGVGI